MTAEQRDYAETIRHSAEALLTTMSDILDFSKIEAGRIDLETVDFDLRQVVEEVAELIASAAQEKGIELISHIDVDMPAVVRGDPSRLRQVLNNLIGNAVKFTHQGEVVVRVASSEYRVASESDSLLATRYSILITFSVSDTGIGIAPEAQSRLFQPFSQADGSITRRYSGTGLGLAISKQLVELMGGHLSFESVPGSGSTFAFTLTFEASVPTADTPPLPDDLAELRVLLVDANATSRSSIETVLRSRGASCESASDGLGALAALEAGARIGQPYDVALLDLKMPGLGGLHLAQRIKADPATRHVRLILLVSPGVHGSITASEHAGIAAVLAKPIRHSHLDRCLRAVMEGSTATVVATREAPARPSTADAAVVVRDQAPRPRLLLAEDNLVTQKVAARQLQKLGYDVDIVGNGREAVEAFKRQSYPAILMDCQMPEMSGFEAAAAIRAVENGGRRTPIIAMTAAAMEGDRELCLDAGMDDYITKPVSFEQLEAVLAAWIPRAAPRPTAPVDLVTPSYGFRARALTHAMAALTGAFTPSPRLATFRGGQIQVRPRHGCGGKGSDPPLSSRTERACERRRDLSLRGTSA